MTKIRNLGELYEAVAEIMDDIKDIKKDFKIACHKIECIERAVDAQGHLLYKTDKSVLEIKKQISMLSSGLSIPTKMEGKE